MRFDVGDLAEAVGRGDRRALARAITLVESTRPDDRLRAEDLLQRLLPATGSSLRIGVTGTPGVGKSTLIDALGSCLVDRGHRLAVLAVDPSSATGGGSILGDKTRMGSLSRSDQVYIRPSPSGGLTGGVAGRTRDAVLVCEAAGHDVVLVETVGVGQSEVAVAGLTDVFLLLIAPGGGDDLQGIKRGVMELADVVAVTKADGVTGAQAEQTAAQYRQGLHLLRPRWPGRTVPVLTCSALEATGLDDLWAAVTDLHAELASSGRLSALRSEQATSHLQAEVEAALVAKAAEDPTFVERRRRLRQELADGTTTVTRAARLLAETAWADARRGEPAGPDEKTGLR